uniref:Chitin synthase regulator n=1 Tax=Myoviridae sp. ctagO6 TaxID=2826667 RepID=A0A8S5NNM6_9CAUD|nr:MAG TPA: chitin synthase regulator [Myoviridae sp. ctagO6]DAG39420.1 MAG TPA: chitin synthase regulator [Caudoviricetes sp.]
MSGRAARDPIKTAASSWKGWPLFRSIAFLPNLLFNCIQICGARRRRRGRGQLRGSAPRSGSEILLKSIWLSRRIRHRRIHYACRHLQGRVTWVGVIKTPAGAS